MASRTLFDKTRLGNGCLTEYDVIVSTLAAFDFRKWGSAARMSRTWLMKERLTAFSHVASSNEFERACRRSARVGDEQIESAKKLDGLLDDFFRHGWIAHVSRDAGHGRAGFF